VGSGFQVQSFGFRVSSLTLEGQAAHLGVRIEEGGRGPSRTPYDLRHNRPTVES